MVNPPNRLDAHDEDLVALLDQATGIFMSGGSQLKLSQRFPGTPLGDALPAPTTGAPSSAARRPAPRS